VPGERFIEHSFAPRTVHWATWVGWAAVGFGPLAAGDVSVGWLATFRPSLKADAVAITSRRVLAGADVSTEVVWPHVTEMVPVVMFVFGAVVHLVGVSHCLTARRYRMERNQR
jgi:hypothetical protein